MSAKVLPIGDAHHKVQTREVFEYANAMMVVFDSTHSNHASTSNWMAVGGKQRNVTDNGWIFRVGTADVHVHDQDVFMRGNKMFVITATGAKATFELSVRRELTFELFEHLKGGGL